MGERAKKKRAAESKAARLAKKPKKATEDTSEIEDDSATDPTTSDIKLPSQSKVKKTAEQATQPKKGAASRVPSSASTQARHSARLLGSSSKLGSGGKKASAKGHDDESTMATRPPKRSATAAANALLQQLEISGDEEENPDGESNDEADKGTDLKDLDDEMESDEGSDDEEGSDDDDGSEIEVIDHRKINLKPVPSAKQKGKGPASSASHHVQRKPKAPSVNEDSSSDDSDDSEPQFEMTFEINDKARGARKNLTLPSSTSLAELQDRVAQVFNVHTASLQLQYIFSNEKNNSLPFDLRSHEEYIDMRDKLQPFVVPKILANGKPSKTVRKLVTVQLFNRGMEGVSGEKGTKKSAKSPQAGEDNNPTSKKDELYEKKLVIIEQLTEHWQCHIHSLPDKPVLCWTPVEERPHGPCYPIIQSNINFWASCVAREPTVYSTKEKPPQLNLKNNMPRGAHRQGLAASQPAPLPAPPMPPYGFYPPPNPYFLNPTGMQWAGGLPPQAGPPVPGPPQPNPTAPGGPQKHIRGPHISAWLQYCDRLPGRDGENFSAFAEKFDKEGYRTIDQLIGSRMSVENLSNWLGIGKGIADRIIQYAEEDMAYVRDGNFTMDLEPRQDWAGF